MSFRFSYIGRVLGHLSYVADHLANEIYQDPCYVKMLIFKLFIFQKLGVGNHFLSASHYLATIQIQMI